MDVIKQLFPLSFKGNDSNACVISVIVYLVAAIIVGVVVAILDFIHVVNILLGAIGTIFGLYCLAGIVFSILNFTKVIK